MKKTLSLVSFVLIMSAIPAAAERTFHWRGWTFELAFADPISGAREAKTMKLLKKLIMNFDLSPWIRTREVKIQDGAASHSDPLTINTRHNDDVNSLLATFLHEQIHKLEQFYPDDFHAAMDEVERLFPKRIPDYSRDVTYRHYIVAFFEIDALTRLLGKPTALRVIGRKDKYQWIYQKVLDNTEILREIFRRHGLPARVHG